MSGAQACTILYVVARAAASFGGPLTDGCIGGVLLSAAMAAGAQSQVATTSTLSVGGGDPYNLSCIVAGTATTTIAGPTGSVTFTDATANQTLVVEPLGAAAQTPAFIPEGLSPAGVTATAVADFNGDGKPDLAILTRGVVFVALGNGDGTFAAPTNVATVSASGALYESIVAGDFNGDGLMDAAIVYSVNGAQTLEVLLNKGNGTFQAQAPVTPGLPAMLSGIVAVNFSSNGIWGLVAGDANSGTVVSMASNSSGTLQSPVSYTVSGNIDGVVTGDFNGDKKVDVAVTTATGVAVLLNGGIGTFGSPIETSLGYSSGQPIAGDYSGDGVLDLLVYHAGEIWLVAGKGDGSFQSPGAVLLTQESYLAGGDFNGDGKPDLALETLDSLGHPNALAIYLGNGAGGLEQASSEMGFFQANDILMASADLSGDGRSDLLGLRGNGGGSNTAEIWRNTLAANAIATAQNVAIAAGGTTTHNLNCVYGGDGHYAASTSLTASVSIPVTSLAVTSSTSSQTVAPGQTASYTLTVTPAGGYAGTVKLACGSLPSETECSFSPGSIAITGGAAQSMLSIRTMAATTGRNKVRAAPFGRGPGTGTAVLAALLGLCFAPARVRHRNLRLRVLVYVVLLSVMGLSLVDCSSGGSSAQKNPGTPVGTYTVMVTAADSSGTPASSLQLTLVVQ